MLIALGYTAAILIGISLGLIGGGGSILTVPVLVYLLQVNPVLATAYSLFVVGVTSLVGSFQYHKQQLISYKHVFVFGIPSIFAVFLTRKFLVPAIPDELFFIGAFVLTKAIFMMVLFAILMVFASVSMIRKPKGTLIDDTKEPTFNYAGILLEGSLVGVLTGLVGAGGGFLIIPALVIFSGLSMKKAIGTSLLIIALKSLIGFLGDVSNTQMDWPLLLLFSSISVLGIFVGASLAKKINGQKLKVGFGWFVLIMGFYILIKELFL